MELPDCGDSSCCFAETRTGMRTNGGCRCFNELPPAGPHSHTDRLLRLARGLAQDRRQLTKERDEARRVARELAHSSLCRDSTYFAEWDRLAQTALAYPDLEGPKT